MELLRWNTIIPIAALKFIKTKQKSYLLSEYNLYLSISLFWWISYSKVIIIIHCFINKPMFLLEFDSHIDIAVQFECAKKAAVQFT